MNVLEAINSRRTIRRFEQKRIPEDELIKIVAAARLTAHGANRQPLKYIIVSSPEMCDKVFSHTKWAGYIPDGTPREGERPTAYIAIISDSDIRPIAAADVDCGLAMTTIMLASHELGLGSCAIGSIDRTALHNLFELSENHHVSYLVALGYTAQKGSFFDMEDGNIKYYYDENGDVFVPKRKLDEILIKKI